MVYVYGAFMHWTHICYFAGATAILTSITALTILPESPVWLFLQGRHHDTFSTLEALRGSPADGIKIKEEVSCMTEAKSSKFSNLSEDSSAIKTLIKPEAYKPISLILVIFLFVNFSGANAILAFGVDLVQDFGFSKESQYLPAIIISSMRLFGTMLGVFLLIPKLRRKTVMISTAMVMFLCHMGMALVTFLKHSTLIPELAATWISMVLVSVYLLAFGSGAGTIPWSLAGELVPMKVFGAYHNLNLQLE